MIDINDTGKYPQVKPVSVDIPVIDPQMWYNINLIKKWLLVNYPLLGAMTIELQDWPQVQCVKLTDPHASILTQGLSSPSLNYNMLQKCDSGRRLCSMSDITELIAYNDYPDRTIRVSYKQKIDKEPTMSDYIKLLVYNKVTLSKWKEINVEHKTLWSFCAKFAYKGYITNGQINLDSLSLIVRENNQFHTQEGDWVGSTTLHLFLATGEYFVMDAWGAFVVKIRTQVTAADRLECALTCINNCGYVFKADYGGYTGTPGYYINQMGFYHFSETGNGRPFITNIIVEKWMIQPAKPRVTELHGKVPLLWMIGKKTVKKSQPLPFECTANDPVTSNRIMAWLDGKILPLDSKGGRALAKLKKSYSLKNLELWYPSTAMYNNICENTKTWAHSRAAIVLCRLRKIGRAHV